MITPGAVAFAAIVAANAMKSLNGPLAPAPQSGDFVFVVAGDNRPTAKGAPLPHVLPTIFSEIRLIHPDLVLWTGDTVYGYRDSHDELKAEYDTFVALAKRADVPIFNAPGNHEIHEAKPCDTADAEQQFVGRFGALYGSFDYRGVHFIALDTEQCGHTTSNPDVQVVDGPQLDWLKGDLEAHRDARAIIVCMHTEITPAPNDEDAANHLPLGNAAELRDLLKQYPVKAVFQGHEHLFYRTPDDHYYVAGGAGAPKYAPPENGGFSHYLVVAMKGNEPAVTIVEPGHFYVERGTHGHAAWLVNATDTPIPARRAEFSVPASTGKCGDLVATTTLTKWDGTPIPVPVAITKCTTAGGKRNLTLAVTGNVPRRSSVPIDVHRRK